MIFKPRILESFNNYSQRPLYINLEHTFSLCDFSSGDALWKKTIIKAKMLNGGGDIKEIFKACPTSLRSSELNRLATLALTKLGEIGKLSNTNCSQNLPIAGRASATI